MEWVLIIGVTWLLVAVAVALLVARSIRRAREADEDHDVPEPPRQLPAAQRRDDQRGRSSD